MGTDIDGCTARDLDNFRRVAAFVHRARAGSRGSRPSSETVSLAETAVAELRRHAHRVGAVEPGRYDVVDETRRALFRDKLKRLTKLAGEDILVAESPELGGFGYDINGRLYNLDTLKFYEVLTALRRGGVLNDLLLASEPRLVVQVGPAWGGFAYQFKSLCPTATCLVASDPSNFLFSATYLMHQFPQARFLFVESETEPIDPQSHDFIFVPRDRLAAVKGLRPDLVASVLGLESMTPAQVSEVVGWAYESRARFVYSLDRECRGGQDSVLGLLSQAYWPHVIPVMPVSFNEMLDGIARGKSMAARAAREEHEKPEYRHVIGWRRMMR